MTRFFLKIYDFLQGRKYLTWILLLFTLAVFAVASLHIEFKEDITDFLPADKQNQDVFWAFSNMGSTNKAIITISQADNSSDVDEYCLMEAVDTLAGRITSSVPESFIDRILYKVDDGQILELTDFVVDHLPYYMTEDDYARLDSLVASGSFDNELALDRRLISTPAGYLMRRVAVKDPLMLSSAHLKMLQDFSPQDSFSTVDGYMFTKDGSALLILDLSFSPGDTKSAGKFINLLDDAIAQTESRFDGKVEADKLGGVFIAHTNSSQIKKDSFLSILIAVVIIAFLLVSFFRSGKPILLVGVSLLYGFILAMGFAAIAMDSLSLVVIGMGAVIIGIAANYPLHYLTHISQGYSPRDSLRDIVQPLTTGNITTVGAFLSLLFIASPAMHDLGLFSAFLLIGTILFTLVFLPHLSGQPDRISQPARFWNRIAGFDPASYRFVLPLVVLLTLIFSFFDDRVQFDSDLHNINYMTDRQQANMDRMLELAQGDRCITYVAICGNTLDEALDNYSACSSRIDSLSLLCEDANVSAIHDFLPSPSLQAERLERWNEYMSRNGETLAAMVATSAKKAGFKDGVFEPFSKLLSTDYQILPYSSFDVILESVAVGKTICSEERSAVVSTVGSGDNLTEAVSEALSGTDAIVFDASTMSSNMVKSLSRDFDTVLYVCAFIVFALLLVSFSRIELAGIAFLPLTIGWIWILGLMGIFSVDLNIINIILATFIFGMGDDYTIFITEGLMYEYAYGRRMLCTYRRTICLSALIMFVGMGALAVAKHPAMLSLAYVTVIGMLCVVLMAEILPPVIFRWLTFKKGEKRIEPVTLLNFSATLLAFIFLIVFSAILTVAGFFLITLTFNSAKGKLLYHRLLSAISGFVFNHVFFTKASLECREDFEKPAVIIANHQSHLDLMALLMLTPKMVVVTNKWVWNNPFYGLVIRYADFCPVEKLMADDMNGLEKFVSDGYSVLVFPEGTRTVDGKIGRFHKGAFYMAEKFGLDILPVILHGFNDVLPKQDLLLRKGRMTVKVLDRISPDDPSFGTGSFSRSKLLRRMMSAELAEVARATEDVEYYKDRVQHAYIYKGATVSREVRRTLRECGCFRELADSLPKGGNVLFVNPGYGESSLICALARKDVRISACFDDPMLCLMAENCAGLPDNLIYTEHRPDGEFDRVIEFREGRYE